MEAQMFPPAVPGLVRRKVASGAPAVLALEKYSTFNVSAGGVTGSTAHADTVQKASANVHTTSTVVRIDCPPNRVTPRRLGGEEHSYNPVARHVLYRYLSNPQVPRWINPMTLNLAPQITIPQ